MDLLIKGMEMPIFEHQSWDIRKGMDGKWYMVDTNAETSDDVWHEIVPIPSHGRCIDADATERHLVKMQMAQKDIVARGIRKSRGVVRNMPTIIPAEEDINIQKEFLQNWHEEDET